MFKSTFITEADLCTGYSDCMSPLVISESFCPKKLYCSLLVHIKSKNAAWRHPIAVYQNTADLQLCKIRCQPNKKNWQQVHCEFSGNAQYISTISFIIHFFNSFFFYRCIGFSRIFLLIY